MTLTRLYELAAVAQITPTWVNANGTSTLYSEGGSNTITLTLTNNLAAPLTLQPGAPAEEGSLPANVTNIYVDFRLLLGSVAATSAVNVEFDGTTLPSLGFPGSSNETYLAIAFDEKVIWSADDSLVFTLTNITAVTTESSPVSIVITVAGALGMGPQQTAVAVTATTPPASSDLPMDLVVGWAGTDIVITGTTQNTLTLQITNPATSDLVTLPWGEATPTFILTLVCDDSSQDPGALLTSSAVGGVAVNLGESYSDSGLWLAVYKGVKAGTWMLQPAAKNQSVLGWEDASDTVELVITGIVSDQPQGLTYAYLQYQNFPDIANGGYAIEITKLDPIVITSFTAGPPAAPDAWGGSAVTLSFAVDNVTSVAITNTPYQQQIIASGSVTDTVEVTPYATTAYTLVAGNLTTGQMLAKQLEVTVAPQHLVPAGAILMWSGSSANIPAGWLLCDGMNGTPDLRGQFVIGAAANAGISGPVAGQTGGSAIHTHSAAATTASAGEHTHAWPPNWHMVSVKGGEGTATSHDLTANDNSTLPPLGTNGAHTHDMTVTNAASENLPPWYALCYIMLNPLAG